ncbi:ATP-binding protein [Uniformispora flossi]|uniref:ATP-binding protein n=1 Tax=Uniformispora flossi TaxID=3390723 RepID=UPI003C2CB4FD
MDAHPLALTAPAPFAWSKSRHQAEWQFVRDPRCAGGARLLLHEHADEWGIAADSADTAALLVSELVTNAYRYGAAVPASTSPDLITVRCFLAFGLLRIEVSDGATELPRPRHASPDDVSGRGLALVTALADRWGAYPAPADCRSGTPAGGGKTVWCELTVIVEAASGSGPGFGCGW